LLETIKSLKKDQDKSIEDKYISDLKVKLKELVTDRIKNFMALLRFAFRLKELSDVDSKKVQAIATQLPNAIKQMTTSNICLPFYYHKYYLYAFTEVCFDGLLSDQKLGAHETTKPTIGASWTVELTADGEAVYLKNVDLDMYLYATDEQFPKYHNAELEAKKIHLGPKNETDPAFRWKFVPIECFRMLVQNIGNSLNLEWACASNNNPTKAICLSSKEDEWAQWRIENY
jgi:hypothetical protein